MSEITIEKKLELLQQIRSKNEQNRFDMSRREQIIYGKTMEPMINGGYYQEVMDEDDELPTFPLRALLAVALFLLMIICDMSGKSFMGIQTSICFDAIATDYESSITAWVDAASKNVSYDSIEENPPAGSRP